MTNAFTKPPTIDDQDEPAAAAASAEARPDEAAVPDASASTDLVVTNRWTGEQLDLRSASLEQLARFTTDLKDLREEAGVQEDLVSNELVARLDRDANWTQRVGDQRAPYQYEITAPSPNASTPEWPVLGVEEKLRELLVAGVISETAASRALKRHVVLSVAVPFDEDLDELVDRIRASADQEVVGVTVDLVRADLKRQSMVGGINRLLKIPAAKAKLEPVKRDLPVGSRRAAVRLITRER